MRMLRAIFFGTCLIAALLFAVAMWARSYFVADWAALTQWPRYIHFSSRCGCISVEFDWIFDRTPRQGWVVAHHPVDRNFPENSPLNRVNWSPQWERKVKVVDVSDSGEETRRHVTEAVLPYWLPVLLHLLLLALWVRTFRCQLQMRRRRNRGFAVMRARGSAARQCKVARAETWSMWPSVQAEGARTMGMRPNV